MRRDLVRIPTIVREMAGCYIKNVAPKVVHNATGMSVSLQVRQSHESSSRDYPVALSIQ